MHAAVDDRRGRAHQGLVHLPERAGRLLVEVHPHDERLAERAADLDEARPGGMDAQDVADEQRLASPRAPPRRPSPPPRACRRAASRRTRARRPRAPEAPSARDARYRRRSRPRRASAPRAPRRESSKRGIPGNSASRSRASGGVAGAQARRVRSRRSPDRRGRGSSPSCRARRRERAAACMSLIGPPHSSAYRSRRDAGATRASARRQALARARRVGRERAAIVLHVHVITTLAPGAAQAL